jgi:4'-phosphopantetheinyl transferase
MTRDSGFGMRGFGDNPLSNSALRISYLMKVQSEVPDSDDWLSVEEKKIADGFRVPKRRNDWLLGRWTAKQSIIACHKDEYPIITKLEIRAARDGAPEAYYGGMPARVSLSISHSHGRAFCAVAPEDIRLGCDLEWMESREPNFASDYFTPEELSLALQLPGKRELVENLIWSAKEATLKVLRKGLTRDTRSVRVRVDFTESTDPWQRWTGECLEYSRIFQGWWRAADGFVYSIASDRLQASLHNLSCYK